MSFVMIIVEVFFCFFVNCLVLCRSVRHATYDPPVQELTTSQQMSMQQEQLMWSVFL